MSAPKHPPTLLIRSLPPQALVGIDLLSLTASSRFNGVTALPSGWHFLFVGADQVLSSRQGLWFRVPEEQDAPNQAHAGKKRQRADSQMLGVRGEILQQDDSIQAPNDAWFSVVEWSREVEQLLAVDDMLQLNAWREKLLSSEELQKSLFPYRQTVPPQDQSVKSSEATEPSDHASDFPSLTRHISEHVLERICGPASGSFWTLDTASTTHADAEAEKIPGLSLDEHMLGRPLGLLEIDLKVTWPTDAVGRDRTDAARDRSWRLEHVVHASLSLQTGGTADPSNTDPDTMMSDAPVREDSVGGPTSSPAGWGSYLLGEFEFCFIMILCLSNWSCLTQWRRIIELCLTCEASVLSHPQFFANMLDTLGLQIQHTHVVEGGLFDVEADGGEFLKRLLRRFDKTLAELERDSGPDGLSRVRASLSKVKDIVHDVWGWELDGTFARQGMVRLEDGEEVEMDTLDFDENDETGEYAPVVVET